MNFKSEMEFTNKVHTGIAVPRFYTPNGMMDVRSEVGTDADLKDGIDYVVHDFGERPITVQERFRRANTKHIVM